MTESSASTISRQWLRRYKTLFFIAIILLCIQLFLGYLLPIFSTLDDLSDSNAAPFYVLDGERIRADSLSIDDEEISNSNGINHYKDAASASKIASLAKDDSHISTNDSIVINHATPNLHLNLDELKFRPICDIITREAISAIQRAKTQACKETIVNITCAIQNGQFYPNELPSRCEHGSYQMGRALGCFQDDKKFRVLSGYYISFKTINTPARCIHVCLQSGFVYAGVQYS